MTEIITYRLSATGIWGYEFYGMNRTLIGSVHSVVAPSAPVRIESGNLSWYSRFDIDTKIIPGTGRRIKENQTGEEVYRIIFWQPGLYQVRTPDDRSIQVEIRKDVYLFGKPMLPVTAMTERITEAEWIPTKHLEVSPCFRTTVYDDVSDEYLLMALSFPALRMY
jgi:hypothetical protein